MNRLHEFGIIIIAHVTVITCIGALLSGAAQRHATIRHAIGFLALLLVLASPALALILPQPAWWNALTSRPHREQSAVLTPESSLPADPTTVATINGPTHPLADQSESLPEELASKSEPTPASRRVAQALLEPAPASIGRPALNGNRQIWIDRSLNLAGGLWAVGILILACRMSWSQWHLRRLRLSIQASSTDSASQLPTLRSTLESVCRSLAIPERPALAVSDITPLPVLLGLRRLVIVLPSELTTTASPDRLRDVLVHECAHIARHDPWVNLAQQFATVLFWIHPGIYWLNRQIARAREELCDNFVLQHGDPADYAQLLLELAEQCAARRTTMRALGILGSRWTLEHRIAGLLDPRRAKSTHVKHRNVALIALVMVALTMLVGGVGAFQDKPDRTVPKVAPESTILASAPKRISIHGTCRSSDRKPIPDASVRVFRCQSLGRPILMVETRTDVAGRYAFLEIEYPAYSCDLCVAATANGYASAVDIAKSKTGEVDLPLELSNSVGTLSGVVTDPQGRPVHDAVVFLPGCYGDQPLPGIRCSVTDDQGGTQSPISSDGLRRRRRPSIRLQSRDL
jgi:beta-lactamase regulating signal transducer with metallopeptidase domain